jgi:hypothetical protein
VHCVSRLRRPQGARVRPEAGPFVARAADPAAGPRRAQANLPAAGFVPLGRAHALAVSSSLRGAPGDDNEAGPSERLLGPVVPPLTALGAIIISPPHALLPIPAQLPLRRSRPRGGAPTVIVWKDTLDDNGQGCL